MTRGDEQVVRKVATNETARFSETGFTRLVERAAEDAELQDILHGRGDVPAHHASALIAAAKERARAEIMGSMAGRALARTNTERPTGCSFLGIL